MLKILLLVATFARSSLSATIECPFYVHVDRNSTGPVKFQCQITYANVDEVVQSEQLLRWATKPHGKATNAHVLRANETHDLYSLHVNFTSELIATVDVTISYFNAASDYNRTFQLVTRDQDSDEDNEVAAIRLIEGKIRPELSFMWWDYLIYLSTIVLYGAIGIYYTCYKWSPVEPGGDYILGPRNTGWFPSTMSLFGTFLSALPVLGGTSEFYVFGTQYLMVCVAYILSCAISAHVLLPIFYRLKITSVHEYLEMRFSKQVRVACSFVFIIQTVLYMAMVIYAPSMALEASSNLNFWFFALITAFICLFYTSIAGLNANYWIDIIQSSGFFIGMFILLGFACETEEGGFIRAWQKAAARGRISFFQMDPDVRYRNSFWTTTIGMTVTFLYTYGVAQTQVEVGLMAGTLRDAQIACWLNVLMNMGLIILPGFIGICAYSHYIDCDPVSAGIISSYDKVLVYYMMDAVADHLPGVPGLFVAVLSIAALSGLSCGLLALVATTVKDFGIHAIMKRQGLSENRMNQFAKIVSGAYVIICLLLLIPIRDSTDIVTMVSTLFGALGGPVLGVFLCGIFIPWISDSGVMLGLIVAVGITVWNGLLAILDLSVINAQQLPAISTMACALPVTPNGTFTPSFTFTRQTNFEHLTDLQSFYAISYLYLAILGVLIVIFVGVVVTALENMYNGKQYCCTDSTLIHHSVLSLMRQLHFDIVQPDRRRSRRIDLPLSESKQQRQRRKLFAPPVEQRTKFAKVSIPAIRHQMSRMPANPTSRSTPVSRF